MPTIGPNMDHHRKAAISRINDCAGRMRRKDMTDIPFQDTIYNEKYREAVKYLALPPSLRDLRDAPWVEDGVGVDGDTPEEVAQVFIDRHGASLANVRDAEKARREAIMAVRNASDRTEIERAVMAFCTDTNT